MHLNFAPERSGKFTSLNRFNRRLNRTTPLTPMNFIKKLAKLHDTDLLASINLLECNDVSTTRLHAFVNKSDRRLRMYVMNPSFKIYTTHEDTDTATHPLQYLAYRYHLQLKNDKVLRKFLQKNFKSNNSNVAHKSVSSKYFNRTTPSDDTNDTSVLPSHPYTLDVDKNLTPLQYVKHFAKLYDSDFLDSIMLLERNNTSLMKFNEIVNQPGCDESLRIKTDIMSYTSNPTSPSRDELDTYVKEMKAYANELHLALKYELNEFFVDYDVKNKTLHIEEHHSLGDKTTMFITDSNSKCRSLPPNMELAQATLSIANLTTNNTSADSSITHWENTFLDYNDRSPSHNIKDAIPTMSYGHPTTGLISPDDSSPLPTIDRVTPESEITKNVQFDPSITNHCSKGQSLPPTVDGAQTSVSNADSTTNIGSPGSITHLATTCLDSDDRSLPLDIQSTTPTMSTGIADSPTKFIDASDRSPTPDSPKTETTPASTNNTIVDPSQMPPPGTNDLRQCRYPILTSIQNNPTSKSNIVIEHNEIFENAVTLHCHPDEPPGHPNHKHLHMDYHAISFDKIIVKLLESLPVTIMVKLLASLPVTIFFSHHIALLIETCSVSQEGGKLSYPVFTW